MTANLQQPQQLSIHDEQAAAVSRLEATAVVIVSSITGSGSGYLATVQTSEK